MRDEACREENEGERVYRREGGKKSVQKGRREEECREGNEGERVYRREGGKKSVEKGRRDRKSVV